jgi:signal recognition particle receptor subunit beta
MVSLNTETDRTLFFDLLPLEVGIVGGFKAKLQLYTVPGQVFYNSTRKLVLKGVDGIVFVADSQAAMLDANRESLQNLTENLRELGLHLGEVPMVFQWNKRDLKQIVSVDILEGELNPKGLPSFQAIARNGEGVFETLRGISRLALAHIKRMHLGDSAPAPARGADWAQPQGVAPEAPSWAAPTPGTLRPPGLAATPAAPLDLSGDLPLDTPHGLPSDLPIDLPPVSALFNDPSLALSAHPPPAAPMIPTPPSVLPRSAAETVPVPAAGSGESLAEALSFLDLSSALDLFEQVSGGPEAGQEPPAPGEEQVKVMPPMFVKLPPPQARGSATVSPVVGASNGLPRPRLALKPPSANVPVPKVSWPPPPVHPGTPRGGPVLQVLLPPEAEGDELELQVVVRNKGVVVAEAATALPAVGAEGSGALSVELKRS